MTSRRAQRRAALERRPVVDERERELVQASARRLLQRRPNDGGGGLTAFYRAERAQVPAEWRRPPIVAIPLYCYEVALDFLLRHADQPVTLTHGVVWEPEGPGGIALPWNHAWVELEADDLAAVYDPATGLHYQRSSYYEVLAARPLVCYSAAQAEARLAATRWPGPWDEAEPAHQTLVAGCLAQIHAAVPGLAAWVEGMVEADPQFKASYRQAVAYNDNLAVHVQARIAQHPEWWRQHHPGEPWPHHAEVFDHYLYRDEHAEER